MRDLYRERHDKERRDRREKERDREREKDRFRRRRDPRDVYNPYQVWIPTISYIIFYIVQSFKIIFDL